MIRSVFLRIVAVCALIAPAAEAVTILSGTASFTFLEGIASSVSEFDALFSDATSRANLLSLAAPGNAAFTESAVHVQYSDPVRPHGQIPAEHPGTPGETRSRQITNLDFNPADLLGSWAAATDQGIFVPLGSGEQIALTLMQRWSGPFTGALLYGDFALRHAPGRVGDQALGGTLSGLVLTSNIDFLNSAFADLANASISFSGNTLTISADLLIGDALNVLDPNAVVGTKFGTLTLTAATVPEPSSGLLLALAGGLLASTARRRKPIA